MSGDYVVWGAIEDLGRGVMTPGLVCDGRNYVVCETFEASLIWAGRFLGCGVVTDVIIFEVGDGGALDPAFVFAGLAVTNGVPGTCTKPWLDKHTVAAQAELDKLPVPHVSTRIGEDR